MKIVPSLSLSAVALLGLILGSPSDETTTPEAIDEAAKRAGPRPNGNPSTSGTTAP